MAESPLANATYYEEGQDLGHVAVNDAIDRLEVAPGPVTAQSKTVNNPSGLSPTNGQNWIVGTSGAGEWLGHSNELATYRDGWVFRTIPLYEMFVLVDEGTAGEIIIKTANTPTYRRVADINGLSTT